MNAENNLFSSFIYKKADLVLLTCMVFTHQTFEQIIAYFLRHWMFISQRSGDSCKQHSKLYCVSFTLLKKHILQKLYYCMQNKWCIYPLCLQKSRFVSTQARCSSNYKYLLELLYSISEWARWGLCNYYFQSFYGIFVALTCWQRQNVRHCKWLQTIFNIIW